MKTRFQYIAVFAAVVLLARLAAAENPLDLAVLGAGSWIVSKTVESGTDSITARTYFNKATFGAYLSFSRVKAFINIPLSWTARYVDSPSHAFWLGDISGYAGVSLGIIEPRVGLVVPTGYKLGNTPWIGSGNLKLQAGAALNAALREDNQFNWQAEVMARAYISESSRAILPSWELAPSAKASYRFSEKFLIGTEVLGAIGFVNWTWGKETSVGIVPHLYTEIKLSDWLRIVTKAGIGPTFKKRPTDKASGYESYSINLSASANLYP